MDMSYIRPLVAPMLMYLCAIVAHFAAANLYSYYCTPMTVWGLLVSPFIAPMPHCYAFRWTIHQTSYIIENMWIIIGLSIVNLLRQINIPLR